MPKAKIPHLKLVELLGGRLSDEARKRKQKEFEILEVRNSVEYSVGDAVLQDSIAGLLRAGKLTTSLVPRPKGGSR